MLTVRMRKGLAAALTLLGMQPIGYAVDSTSFEFGARDKVQMARIGAQSDWQRIWQDAGGKQVGHYWDLTFAQWRQNRYRGILGNTHNIIDVGITPILAPLGKS